MVVTTNNSKLPITHVGETKIVPCYSPYPILLHNVYHILRMKKNLLSMSQLTALRNYIVFRPNDVKVYKNLKPINTLIMKGQ